MPIAMPMDHRLLPILCHHRDFSMVGWIFILDQSYLCSLFLQEWPIWCLQHLRVFHHLDHYHQHHRQSLLTDPHQQLNKPLFSLSFFFFVYLSIYFRSLYFACACVWVALIIIMQFSLARSLVDFCSLFQKVLYKSKYRSLLSIR